MGDKADPSEPRTWDIPAHRGESSYRTQPDDALARRSGLRGEQHQDPAEGNGPFTPSEEVDPEPHSTSATAQADLDADYLAWRAQQLQRYDLDYAAWRRDQAERHDKEFRTWRSRFGGQPKPISEWLDSRTSADEREGADAAPPGGYLIPGAAAGPDAE